MLLLGLVSPAAVRLLMLGASQPTRKSVISQLATPAAGPCCQTAYAGTTSSKFLEREGRGRRGRRGGGGEGMSALMIQCHIYAS